MLWFLASIVAGGIAIAFAVLFFQTRSAKHLLRTAQGRVEVHKIFGPRSSIPSFKFAFGRIIGLGLLRPQGQLLVAKRNLPDLKIRKDGVRVDASHLNAFQALCGYSESNRLFCVYVEHFMFPYLVQMIADAMFPLSPLGLIHVRQSFQMFQKIVTNQAFDMQFHATPDDFVETAKGIELTGHLRVYAADTERLIMSGTATLLSRDSNKKPAKKQPPAVDERTPQQVVNVDVEADLGVKYARLSGDWNPHHLWPWSAKMIGYKLPIVQGLWTLARGMASLQLDYPFRVDCKFAKPLFMPSKVKFEYYGVSKLNAPIAADGVEFVCRNRDTNEPHMFVQFSSLASRSTGALPSARRRPRAKK